MLLPVAPDSDQNSPRDHHRPEYSGGPTNARERAVRVCPTNYATTETLSKYVQETSGRKDMEAAKNMKRQTNEGATK